MKTRFLLPSVFWSGFMLLVFISPVHTKQAVYFDLIPARALAHGLLLMVFSYIACGAAKRQWKYPKIRANAEYVALIASGIWIIMGTILETIVNSSGISGMNLIFDITGVLAGIGAFKLIYGTVQ